MLGPDDMIIKIEELREVTDWQVPIFVKMGAEGLEPTTSRM